MCTGGAYVTVTVLGLESNLGSLDCSAGSIGESAAYYTCRVGETIGCL